MVFYKPWMYSNRIPLAVVKNILNNKNQVKIRYTKKVKQSKKIMTEQEYMDKMSKNLANCKYRS